MKLSIIILNYNVRYFLELCLKSVESAIKNLDAEIIVVDNNSSDDSCDMVKKLFPGTILIENDDNVGFSKANNLGVEHAKGEFVCILNPDTVVSEDTFETLLKFSENKTDLGIAGCRLIDGKGQFLPESKRNIPRPFVALKKMLGFPKSYYANQLSETETGNVPVLVGAFMWMKKSVYQEIGGFDEDYFMYGEDVDISYKTLQAGYQNYYVADTAVIHFKGESTLKNLHYARRFYGAMQIFYKKHFKRNVLFNGLVWLGIKLAFLMRREPQKEIPTVHSYYLLSNKDEVALKEFLNKQLILGTSKASFKPFTEVIFDTSYMSFKEIIGILLKQRLNKNLTFKFLLKESGVFLGSNNSKNKGEVKIYINID